MQTITVLEVVIAVLFIYIGLDMWFNTYMHTRGLAYVTMGALILIVMAWQSRETS